MQQINASGLQLIKRSEGLRLEAYQDPAEIWTIGYGTTNLGNSKPITADLKITEAEAEALLKRDIKEFEAAVANLVTVPLNSNEFSALVSFTYNLGPGNLKDSTLLEYLNAGNRPAAADEFEKWVYAGGRILEGLVIRRRAEKALFLSQDFTVSV
ncbi:MAG: lysozyme [Cyanothece sp. SIO1E1]|nr:lysozyme [Cyanothece sp. SIO1E1]